MPAARSPLSTLVASLCLCLAAPAGGAAEPVTTAADLLAAVNDGAEGDQINIGPGTFELTEPLRVKSGMTLSGAGAGKTVLTNAASWALPPTDRPDNETDYQTADRDAYLLDLAWKTAGVTVEDLTLQSGNAADDLHGAVLAGGAVDLTLRRLHVGAFRWSGVRLFNTKGGLITDCRFVDAGGRRKITAGPVAGCIFVRWPHGLEIAHNQFETTPAHPDHVYGIKGRGARDLRIHHNTVRCNFAIEFPFEGDSGVEIHHNYLDGVVSIPKHAGGGVPKDGGTTFHLHHNYFTTSYAIEGTRNALLVERNLFDFDPAKDGGNLIACFGKTAAPGPVTFRENLIQNPGRGVFWSNPAYDNLTFANNHIVGVETATPRTEGLFAVHGDTDFSTVAFLNNRVELTGPERPLVRHEPMYAATFENNRLSGVSDADRTAGPRTGAVVGPTRSLDFRLGARDAFRVRGFDLTEEEPAPAAE